MPLANIFQPLIDIFEWVLVFFHDSLGIGWGWSIILLTVVVRALLVPLAVKQFRAMKSLASVQPQIKELQKKHGHDKQKLNKEMMRFYQENKVNPLASCLPLIAQIPVFIGLFYMLRKDLRYDICPAINARSDPNPVACGASDASGFFFIPDLTDKATGGVLVVLLVLYVGTQMLSTVLMSTQIQDKNQKYLMMGLPIVFVPFIFSFPAGLLVYWITTNLWTMGQGLALRRLIGVPIPPPRDPDDPGIFGRIVKQAEKASAGRSGEDAVSGGATKGNGGGGRRGSGKGGGAAKGNGKATAGAGGPPPPSPRKKKKQRSGRRR